MFRKGKYGLKYIYWKGTKELIAFDKNYKYKHTHIPSNKLNAARMIVVRAAEGKIPEDYPRWMVVSINRLWYGKDTTRLDRLKK